MPYTVGNNTSAFSRASWVSDAVTEIRPDHQDRLEGGARSAVTDRLSVEFGVTVIIVLEHHGQLPSEGSGACWLLVNCWSIA